MTKKNETPDSPPTPALAHGVRVALVFALVAQRLSIFYEHNQWLTEAQGASLAADWLARRKAALGTLAPSDRRQLSTLSDQLARDIAASLSREAGLYTAHEMMEALDPNYHSEIGQTLMHECERVLKADAVADAPELLPPPPFF